MGAPAVVEFEGQTDPLQIAMKNASENFNEVICFSSMEYLSQNLQRK